MHKNHTTMGYIASYRSVGIVPVTFCLLSFFLLSGCSSDEREPTATVESLPQERLAASDTADVLIESAVRQTVHVPVYSHVYHQDDSRELNLTATLSIRNTDPDHPASVTSVRYHDSAGRLVRRYLDGPLQLPPLSSQSFVVKNGTRPAGSAPTSSSNGRLGLKSVSQSSKPS